MSRLEDLAGRLDDAQLTRRPTTPEPELSLADAYTVQSLVVQRRLGRGERRAGLRLGRVDDPAVPASAGGFAGGRLTDRMLLQAGAVDLGQHLQPSARAALVFRLRERLGPGGTPTGALAAVGAIAAAIEITDGRFRDSESRLCDLVADNLGCAGLIIGPWRSSEIDPSNLGVVFNVNGRPQDIASTAAVLINPGRALAAAAWFCEQWGETLEPGDLVVAGGVTAPYGLGAGETVSVEVQHLGSVSLSVEK